MGSEHDLDELIEQITVDAYGDEAYDSFAQAIEEQVEFPVTASLVGMEVTVTAIEFDGDERRGLVALVERQESTATISILDLELSASDQPIERLVAAYRRWLGIT